MKYPFWVTGFPAVSVVGTPTNAQLDLMLSDSAPNTTIGVEVLSDTPPDVVTYPDLIRCRWVKTSGGYPMGEFYYHNGTTWKLEEATAVDGSKLVNGSVTIDKLSAVGGAPYDFIQVNSLGTGFQFTNTIPISQLENPGVDSKFLISTSGGAWTFSNFYSAVEAFVAAMPIDVTQVSTRDTSGSTNQVVYLTGAGTCSWGWADELLRNGTVNSNKLYFPSDSSNKVVTVNATANGFEYVTISEIYNKWVSGNLAFPTGNGYANGIALNHTFGTAIPSSIKIYVTCIDAGGNCGYSQGDSLDATNLNDSAASLPVISVIRKADGTMKLCVSFIGSGDVGVPNYVTGNHDATFEFAKWNVYVVMIL